MHILGWVDDRLFIVRGVLVSYRGLVGWCMGNGRVLGYYGHGGSAVQANSCYTDSQGPIVLED